MSPWVSVTRTSKSSKVLPPSVDADLNKHINLEKAGGAISPEETAEAILKGLADDTDEIRITGQVALSRFAHCTGCGQWLIRKSRKQNSKLHAPTELAANAYH